ncbi:hypothetical protein KM043_009016 [Ampulex compressa]|nr:hypothetical protein KM043_009016 [Ampulex compressa]
MRDLLPSTPTDLEIFSEARVMENAPKANALSRTALPPPPGGAGGTRSRDWPSPRQPPRSSVRVVRFDRTVVLPCCPWCTGSVLSGGPCLDVGSIEGPSLEAAGSCSLERSPRREHDRLQGFLERAF